MAAQALGAALLLVVLLEGSGFQVRDGGVRAPPHPTVPPVPSGQLGATPPQLHLPPIPVRSGGPSQYVFWSTEDFPAITAGWGGFIPDYFWRLFHDSKTFPDAPSVSSLRSIGVRTVILHPSLAVDTAWRDTAARPVRGLPLRREVRGEVVLYHLR